MGNVNRCCPEKNLVWQMERHSGEKTSSAWLRNCKQLPVCTKLSLRGRPAGRSIRAPPAPPFPGTGKDTKATEKVGSGTISASFILGFLFLENVERTDSPKIFLHRESYRSIFKYFQAIEKPVDSMSD